MFQKVRLRDAVSPTRSLRTLLSPSPDSKSVSSSTRDVEKNERRDSDPCEPEIDDVDCMFPFECTSEETEVEESYRSLAPDSAEMEVIMMSGGVDGDGWQDVKVVDETECLVRSTEVKKLEREDRQGNQRGLDGQQDGAVDKSVRTPTSILKISAAPTTPPQTWAERRRILNRELDLKPLTPCDAYQSVMEAARGTKNPDSASISPNEARKPNKLRKPRPGSASTSSPLSPVPVQATAVQQPDNEEATGQLMKAYKQSRGHKWRSAVVVGEEERLRALAG